MITTYHIKAMLLALPLLFLTCKTTKQDSNVILEFEKTECYGRCPIYKIKVLANNTAYMYPKANIKYKANQKAYISTKAIKTLFSKAEKINFWSLDSVYNNPLISDVPSTIISLSKNNAMKVVKARANLPSNLAQYINEVEQTLTNLDWQKEK